MNEPLSKFLLKDILQDKTLGTLYEQLTIDHTKSLFGQQDQLFDNDYEKLLRYADLLSLSEEEAHQNLAQQIVIMLSQLFRNNDEVQIFKESIYKNVSNFANLKLIDEKGEIGKANFEYLRDLSFYVHKRENQIDNKCEEVLFDSQKVLLEGLSNNQYYSFSAPTSMGKTFVILSYIRKKLKEGTKENFAIIVPTRALLNEIANKIIIRFEEYLGVGRHKIITTTASIRNDENFIAVLTPERLYYSLLKQRDIMFHNLFIDEAHKISEKDKRSIVYYKILDMVKAKAEIKVYFSSPVIPNPDVYLELTNFFIQEHKSNGRAFTFSPVIQNKVYIEINNRQVQCVNSLAKSLSNCGPLDSRITSKITALIRLGWDKCNLIYVSSANKAVDYAIQLCRIVKSNKAIFKIQTDPALEKVATLIEQKIHKQYYLADLIRCGIAYHIGALPAEIRTAIESLIRKPKLIKFCFCTSTLLEGVNVPADNLFIFDNKKGLSKMSAIDAFNLMGRAGRVTLNEYGNVFIVIEDDNFKKYFDEILLKPLPKQDLLPQEALHDKHKKYIVERLLQGKTNLLEVDEKFSDHDFSETTYEYATKCLNMLLHDICAKNESYIVRAFRKKGHLTPQSIIDIRERFSDIVSSDDDINVSAKQKQSLYEFVAKSNINYPTDFNYPTCLAFLEKLSSIFQWSIYEKETLGKGNRLRYYTVILTQWMDGKGLHEIIRGAIEHYQNTRGQLLFYEPRYHFEPYNGSSKHKNYIINEAMKDIEQIINYKFSMYFLRFSEAIIKIRGDKFLENDWYEFVEYGTSNKSVIQLQKYGFLREQSLMLLKPPYRQYLQLINGELRFSAAIISPTVGDEMYEALTTVRINYPELFV